MRGARARTGPDGELIPLTEQDRALWDQDAIAEGVALISATLSEGIDRRLPAPGRDRRGPRRSGARRGHRLAADPRALRPAQAHVRQPDGGAQPRHRRGHGARPGGRARAARSPRRRRAAGAATIASTPSAPTCSRRPAITRPRSRTIARPPAAPRAFRSGTTSRRRPPACWLRRSRPAGSFPQVTRPRLQSPHGINGLHQGRADRRHRVDRRLARHALVTAFRTTTRRSRTARS